jgi:hypothetical protein
MSKTRVTPRISLHKLGEYMVANALRRRQIVRDQMKPLDCIVPRYMPAQSAIIDYLVADGKRDEIIFKQIERLFTANTNRKWIIDRNRLCIEALESFLNVSQDIQLREVIFSKTELTRQPKLSIGGVNVSVRPEVLLEAKNRSGETIYGAAKLYFSKSFPLNKISGEYVAAMVHQYATEHLLTPAERNLCFVVDVFGKNVYVAPRTHIKRRSEMEAAMEEYARAWTDLSNRNLN